MALKFRKFMQARAAMKTGKVVVGHRRQAKLRRGREKKHMRVLASNIRDSDTK